jgi:type I restriction enzyme S subunit
VALEVRNGISVKPDGDAGTRILRISAVRPMALNAADTRFLTDNGSSWEAYRLRNDDLLFTRYNGNPALVGVCARVNLEREDLLVYPDKLIRVRLEHRVALPAFIEKAVHVGASREFIDGKTKTSAGQVGISGGDLKDVPVPLPPLNEQRRIVAKLEALQARSRRAREALDAVPPLLERLRQSILAAAFRGDLTKDWRAKHKDVEPASKLLERIRAERRKKWEEGELAKMKANGKAPKGDEWKAKYKEPEGVDAEGLLDLPEGWCVVELGQVVSRLTNGYVGPTRGIYLNEGVPYLLSKHVKKNVLRFDGETFVSQAFNERNRKSILRTGDVLLVQTGHVGESAVVPAEHDGHNCHAMIVISPVEAVLDGTFLSLFFGAPGTQAAFSGIEKGMTLRHLNCHDVIHLTTVVPSLAEQRAIVDRVHSMLMRIAEAASALRARVRNLGELERTVLAKAFRGELVVQDSTDEPAEVMLARVRSASEPDTSDSRTRKVGGRRT